jgi:hypothetical protein
VVGRWLRHRVGQVAQLLAARRRPPDTTPARRLLPPELFALFEAMPPEDQRHGLTVLARLEAAGERDPVVLQAALLHDVGKAKAGVGLVHRVLRVLLRRSAPPLWRWLSGWPTGWRRPFWAVANHPERGAVWVETQGGGGELVALIRYHERSALPVGAPPEQVLRHAALARADAGLMAGGEA